MFRYLLLSGVGIIVLVIAAYHVIKKMQLFSIIFILAMLQLLSSLVSAYILDQGKYVSELGYVTWNVSAGPSFLIWLSIFLCFIWLFSAKFGPSEIINPSRVAVSRSLLDKVEDDTSLKQLLFIAVSIFSVVYLLFDMAISGVPIFSNGTLDRFNYWGGYSKLAGAEVVNNLLTPFCAGLGFQLASKSKKQTKYFILTLAFLFTRFLLGYKVSGILDLVFAFSVGYIYRDFFTASRKIKINTGKVLSISIGLICVAVTSYLSWQILSGTRATFAEAWGSLVDRLFLLSGHLWWAISSDPELSISHNFLPTNLNELHAVFHNKGEFDLTVGVYPLMLKYGNPDIVPGFILHNVRYTTNFWSVCIFDNGYLITFLMTIVNALLLIVFLHYFIFTAKDGRLISFIILFRVFSIFTSYLCSSGTPTTFYRPNVLLLIILFVMSNILESGSASRSNAHSKVHETTIRAY